MSFVVRFTLLFLFSQPLVAFENFATNLNSVIPPGCATDPDRMGTFWYEIPYMAIADTTIQLMELQSDDFHDVELKIGRWLCADEKRSVLEVEITTPHDSWSTTFMVLPQFTAVLPNGARYNLAALEEPNASVATASPTLNTAVGIGTEGNRYTYYLDAPLNKREPLIWVDEYNAAFELQILVARGEAYSFEIPATPVQFNRAPMPLNGRLSGLWKAIGTSDQGFLISFNSSPRNDSRGIVFFSWYTYDVDGNPLWLTGSEVYGFSDSSVEIPIELVTNGQFQGDATAERSTIGHVTLTAVACGQMDLEYDLAAIGLGSGAAELGRLFALETAGYSCRDDRTRQNVAGSEN